MGRVCRASTDLDETAHGTVPRLEKCGGPWYGCHTSANRFYYPLVHCRNVEERVQPHFGLESSTWRRPIISHGC